MLTGGSTREGVSGKRDAISWVGKAESLELCMVKSWGAVSRGLWASGG